MDNYYIYCSDFNSDSPLDSNAQAVAKLPLTIDVEESYEIALLEAHICAAWPNVTGVSFTMEKIDPEQDEVLDYIAVTIPDQFERELGSLFDKLNAGIEKKMVSEEEVDEWVR